MYNFIRHTQLGNELIQISSRYVIHSQGFLLHTDNLDHALEIFKGYIGVSWSVGYLEIKDLEQDRVVAMIDL